MYEVMEESSIYRFEKRGVPTYNLQPKVQNTDSHAYTI